MCGRKAIEAILYLNGLIDKKELNMFEPEMADFYFTDDADTAAWIYYISNTDHVQDRRFRIHGQAFYG